jgi:two-component system response regulator YesN
MDNEINLLIADDEKIIREGMASIGWEKNGISHVYTAANGEEALLLFEKKKIQIIVTDVKMPGVDGIELGNRIHAMAPAVKIIILSGYNEFDYAKKALRFGAMDYLLKPVDTDELMEAVQKAVSEIKVEGVARNLGEKKKQFHEMEIALGPEDQVFYQNYQGVLKHDKLFFDDRSVPQIQGNHSFSIQTLMAINYVNLNYSRPVSVDDLSDIVNRSRNYFSAQFKKEMGIGLADYLNKVRIQHAKILLRETSYLTYEVAERVGFPEYRYFCTVFKKYAGDTPTHYRESKNTR